MTDKLKPCPLCGGNNVRTTWTISAEWVTCCDDCDTFGPPKNSPEYAESFWNTRPVEDVLKAENQKLTDTLNEWGEHYRKVIDDKGCLDEQHCACVPALREEIQRLRTALEKIADYPPGHWRFDCKDFADCIDISREALKGGGE